MSDIVEFELVAVEALPVKPVRAGVVGRPSPYTAVLAKLREHPGQAYRITKEPLPLTPNKAGQVAGRIRAGKIAGTLGGEFNASDQNGHVFVEFVGSLGVAEYAAGEPARQAAKAARAAKKAEKVAPDAVAATDTVAVSNGAVSAPEFATASAGADVDGW